jgi:hypothetical protein
MQRTYLARVFTVWPFVTVGLCLDRRIILKTTQWQAPPGTLYKEPPEEFLKVFKDKRPVTVGPFTDEYETFVSAAAPVLDPESGNVVMVLGLDILAHD